MHQYYAPQQGQQLLYQQVPPQYQQVQPQQGSETVVLPADAHPGKEYSFVAQNGQSISFAVPAGMGPGMSVSVATGPSYAPAQQQYVAQQQQQYTMTEAQYVAQQQQQLQQQQQQQLQMQMQMQMQQQQQVSRGSEAVTLPADASPGKEYSFTTQDGRPVTFTVPPGMGPGSVVTVQT